MTSAFRRAPVYRQYWTNACWCTPLAVWMLASAANQKPRSGYLSARTIVRWRRL
jgi:hypothetical protein